MKNMATAKAILAFGHVRDYFKLVPRSKARRTRAPPPAIPAPKSTADADGPARAVPHL